MPIRWADISYYQPVVNNAYPHPVLCIRSNDGTFRDPHFPANYAWSRAALDAGRLSALIVYFVYRPPGPSSLGTLRNMIPDPHPRMAVMIDVESWGGQITGDQSDNLNRVYDALTSWLGDSRRVLAYGNQGDLRSLWPRRPEGLCLVVAKYGGAPPATPSMIGHQYSDKQPCEPFGPCDGNISYDYTDPEVFAAALGLTTIVPKDEEDDMPNNIIIRDSGRIALICPTGSLAASNRAAWLSAVAMDAPNTKDVWVQVYVQDADSGVEEWRWTGADLAARGDHYLPRAWRQIADGASHLIVSWDLSACPEGGTLCLETQARN